MQTIIVPAGQRVNLQLADGTMVWLNARTRLTFPTKFSSKNREVTIDGEGYFEVAHDKTRPFIVKTGKYNVKVWGTRFNIKAYTKSDEFETSLIDGSVEIIKPDKEQGIFLKPNDKVFLNKDQLIVKRITNPDQFLWKEGIISFENEPFAEMVKELELYFDLNIEVYNRKILTYHCTGKFQVKDGIEHILKVLQVTNKFSYSINEKRNTITIK
ncbi:MAG: FecR family protein [Bacteroidetes bacterium]|nr:FecR family protein [Bacteroidales bacterium]NJO67874.1 FecR family protein [Bacteroidota bacterium]